MGLKTQLSKWQKCRHSYAVYRMLSGHDVPNGYSLCSFEKQMKRSHQANTRIYGGHIYTYIYIYIHIYTYICILNYIKYICTMVGWDSTTNLFIYIYRIYMRSFYPRPKKKPVRWAITTITTNISYTMLYVMSSILHHLTHNVIMCYVYIYMESNRQQQFWLYTPLHQIYFIQI